MKDLFHFFQLSRPVNILITLFAFTVSCFLSKADGLTFFTEPRHYFWFSCLFLGIVSATGYWINDVFDFKIDRINKPERLIVNSFLSQKKVISVYIPIVALAVIGSFFALPLMNALVIVFTFLMLWVYAAFLKRISVAGNLLIATLTAMVVGFAALLYGPTLALIWTGIFAFEITFIREVIKDVEDIRGDLNFKLKTLPIQAGIKNTKKVLGVAYVLFIISCSLPVVVQMVRSSEFNWQYLLVSALTVQAPAIYLFVQMTRSTNPLSFTWQSRALKYIILTGIISTLLLK